MFTFRRPTRRRLLAAGAALPLAAAFAPGVLAQAFPSQPLTIVVPFPAGGIADSSVRLIGAKLAEALGQQVLVDNRGGAGGQIAASAVKAAKADGHTLLLANIGSHAINRTLYSKLSYDPVKDFEPVTSLLSWTHVLVVPADSKATSVAALVAQMKGSGGKMSFASQGVGSGGHLLAEMFKDSAKVDAQHIPYRGTAQAMQDLLAGRVDFFFDGVGIIPFVKEGKVRALAVADGKRLAQLPDVPTLAEAGVPGVEVTAWFGLVAPAGTPKPVIAQLNQALAKAARDPEVQRRLNETAIRVGISTPETFASFMAAETERLGKVVKASGARAD
ncbi:tripartite tricarboxylate transporter substrate binding protein [Aquincola sp. S2]|uniref:Tripartite tricarboxylate transporter substrate binding protein n=1 Tax=Pseudaquabacterium terrae TaxID=2732868 RepID=A0ABX2ETX3_9BURK|nr:tripartite tricarboxylate transporter substrate binding protein [Aquabacterium terrae]NRF72093.1 tripartite tricarboxylate transporter substrate binding protein [Aquabacterium terrae]